MMTTKQCTKCHEVKDESEFYAKKRDEQGNVLTRYSECKVCKCADVYRNAQANHQNQGGKVYLMRCNRTGATYVGSTTLSLAKRKTIHMHDSKRFNTNIAGAIRMVPERDNWTMTELEYVGYVSTEELREREQYWINEIQPTLNEQAACKEVA